jgi:hypothetical protein
MVISVPSRPFASALLLLLAVPHPVLAQTAGRYDAVHSGTPWFDQRGLPVSAHGGGITKDGDTYYLFGEAHRDMTNAFAGFNATPLKISSTGVSNGLRCLCSKPVR